MIELSAPWWAFIVLIFVYYATIVLVARGLLRLGTIRAVQIQATMDRIDDTAYDQLRQAVENHRRLTDLASKGVEIEGYGDEADVATQADDELYSILDYLRDDVDS
jgi:hypothetical protein